MSVERAFDELRFGPQRTLNLRDGLPTADQAAQRAESWLRERQVAKAGEVLVITGRGSNSEGGVAAVRDALVKLFFSLRRRGVIKEAQEHTAGSFVVTLAPVAALFAAPKRDRHPMEQFVPDPTSLAGLGDETRTLLRELAVRTIQSLGAQSATKRFIQDEMRRQFAALSAAVPDGPERERRLRDAIASAIVELDETFDD
jgi:hypothetical protein